MLTGAFGLVLHRRVNQLHKRSDRMWTQPWNFPYSVANFPQKVNKINSLHFLFIIFRPAWTIKALNTIYINTNLYSIFAFNDVYIELWRVLIFCRLGCAFLCNAKNVIYHSYFIIFFLLDNILTVEANNSNFLLQNSTGKKAISCQLSTLTITFICCHEAIFLAGNSFPTIAKLVHSLVLQVFFIFIFLGLCNRIVT